MKKIIFLGLLLFVPVSAQTYQVSCPAEAKAIVEAVGGCSVVDKAQYSAVYEKCCVVSSAPVSKIALWVTIAVAVLGFGVAGILYYLHARKKETGFANNK